MSMCPLPRAGMSWVTASGLSALSRTISQRRGVVFEPMPHDVDKNLLLGAGLDRQLKPVCHRHAIGGYHRRFFGPYPPDKVVLTLMSMRILDRNLGLADTAQARDDLWEDRPIRSAEILPSGRRGSARGR